MTFHWEIAFSKLFSFTLLLFTAMQMFGQSLSESVEFKNANNLPWKIVFEDDCKKSWQKKWVMDGKKSHITHSELGMDYFSGSEAHNDAGHTVLWTKKNFSGDVKIEFDFTRIDSSNLGVNIMYVLATGSGKGPYKKNIFKWNDLRQIPEMKTYYNHMNTYHISYAAYSFEKNNPDYIRARRYLPETGQGIEGTALPPEYENPDLFAYGIKHHIVIIKQGSKLYMEVSSPTKTKLFWFNTSSLPPIKSGRIGLRQMWTRNSRYANFKIYKL